MIWLKIILAAVLSASPFLLHYHIKQSENPTIKTNGNKPKSTIFSAIKNLLLQIGKFLRFLYRGMKKYDSFRKFFTLIVLIFMLALQFLDFQVASSCALKLQEAETNVISNAGIFIALAPFMTAPAATMLAAALALSFFSYRITNIVLSELHSNKQIFCISALAAMSIILYSYHWFIVGETIFVILLASYVLPPMNEEEKPKGRKPTPLLLTRLSKAA